MSLITDGAALEAFCTRLASADFITVDTEFIRDKTFWPRLCLVQLGGPDDAAAVDVLAPGLDLAPVFRLMADEKILKVFHAGRQDIEIFFHLTGEIPHPIFDSQVAAMVCGFGDSVAYERLVEKIAKGRLDKSMRYTDWSKRPLTDRQLDYALSDVTHLRDIYRFLADKLAETGRSDWVTEEMAVLTARETYDQDPRDIWRRVKTKHRRPRQLAVLRELAAWREGLARSRDVPRNRVIKDEVLAEISARAPKNLDELMHLRSIARTGVSESQGQEIVAAVAAGLAVPDSECPRSDNRGPPPGEKGASIDLLKVLLKLRCETHHVAQRLVATADDIETMVREPDADIPALHGWRRELFGEDALALMAGKLALTGDGNNLRVVDLGD